MMRGASTTTAAPTSRDRAFACACRYVVFSGARYTQCEGAGDEYCDTPNVAACEAAAVYVGATDTSAGAPISSTTKVKGCSIAVQGESHVHVFV
jgi:hypothetical protein